MMMALEKYYCIKIGFEHLKEKSIIKQGIEVNRFKIEGYQGS